MATSSSSTQASFKTISTLDSDAVYLALHYRERRDDNEPYVCSFAILLNVHGEV